MALAAYARLYVVAVASGLAGASVVHHAFKPDLTIPAYETLTEEQKRQARAFSLRPPDK